MITISPDSWQRLANEGTIVIFTVFNISLENPPPLSRVGSGFSRATSPTSFSAQLLSQDQEPLPLRDITTEEQNKANQANPTKKTKRTRLLLDARTELTDDELRVRFMCFMLILPLFDVLFPRLLERNTSSLRIQSDERY